MGFMEKKTETPDLQKWLYNKILMIYMAYDIMEGPAAEYMRNIFIFIVPEI